MPLGTEMAIVLGDMVFLGTQLAPTERVTAASLFVAKQLDGSRFKMPIGT